MEHYVRFAVEIFPVKLESTLKELCTVTVIGGDSSYFAMKLCQKFPHLMEISCYTFKL